MPDACAWCGEPATTRVLIKRRSKTSIGVRQAVTVPACQSHAERLSPVRPAPELAHEVKTVVAPLCESCGAEITWLTILKADGSEGRMPVDRRAVGGRDPRAGMVARNPRTGRGKVLRKVDLGEPWVKQVQLFLSHFASCSSASAHRKRAA